MISVFISSEVDRGFIDGVMISVFTSSEVDREVDRGFIDGEWLVCSPRVR